MNRNEAIEYLTRCADDNGDHRSGGRHYVEPDECPTCYGTNDAGWLAAPGSRYGRTAADMAPFVYRVAVAEGDTSAAMLDHVMSLAVNDSETPQMWLQQYAAELAGANIDAMVDGYLEAQLWAGLDYGHERCDYEATEDTEPHPWDDHYSREDISPKYVETVRAKLAELVAEHPLAVRMYLQRPGKYEGARSQYDRNELFGHDFYLTREGHGTGFWDRGLGELGDYLTQLSKYAGPANDLWDNGNGMLQ